MGQIAVCTVYVFLSTGFINMFMFKYPDEPCSSRTWYPSQVGIRFLSLQRFLDTAIVIYEYFASFN